MKKLILLGALSWLLTGCQTTGQTIKVETTNGFNTEATEFAPNPKVTEKDVVFIAVHGKSGSPHTSHQSKLYPKLTSQGYQVIAPQMPWSKSWNGSFSDGMQLIDTLINQQAEKGKKVVLIGHSLGGRGVIHYAATHSNPGLAGVVSVAPGHMLHKSKRMQNITADSVLKAQNMELAGQENDASDFKELNTGKVKQVRMSAKHYLSYYDLARFPSVKQDLRAIQIPMLWIAGRNDRLTQVYEMQNLFFELPENDKNQYLEINGDHKSVLEEAAQTIIDWANSL